jgi:hypothetical protein
MVTAHNVFEPDDIRLAQVIFDDIWSSIPVDIRSGPRAGEFREWLATQVLTSINQRKGASIAGLKARLRQTDLSAWA